MKYELIIFDCDGVLVDTEPTMNAGIAKNLSRYGLPLTGQQSQNLFSGGSISDIIRWAEKQGVTLPDHWSDEVHKEAYDLLREGVELVPGVVHVLDLLDEAGARYCVASNGDVVKMEITLGQTGLWKRFENNMFSAYRIGIAKPDPGLFLHASKANGADPRKCAVVEDSYSGVSAAIAAGMDCFAFCENGVSEKLSEAGATCFTDMADLPALLGLPPSA